MVVQETFVPNHQRGANKTSLMKLCDLARDLDLDKDFGLGLASNPTMKCNSFIHSESYRIATGPTMGLVGFAAV